MSRILSQLVHPATWSLVRNQTRAKLSMMIGSFGNPRRRWLAWLAVGLGLLWAGQAIGSVLFRQPADPVRLADWLALGLAGYAAWNVIKIVTRAPVEPFEWTPAEREFVLAAPLTRMQQIGYRLVSIFLAAVLKATCFSLLMIPDIPIMVAGWIGMLFGLLLIDLIRVAWELAFDALSPKSRHVVRWLVLTMAGGCLLWTVGRCLGNTDSEQWAASPAAIAFFQQCLAESIQLANAWPVNLLVLPFKLVVGLILAPAITANWLLSLAAVGGIAAGLFRLLFWLDQYRLTQVRIREQSLLQLQARTATNSQSLDGNVTQRVTTPPRLKGIGSLVYRQLLGLVHYRTSVAISLIVPIALSCLPLLARHDPGTMLLHIVASAVFYSFLLLPSALMLDFRRDIQRMAVLKSLPISPLATTIGQLAVPVLVCTLFQIVVLSVAVFAGAVVPWQAMIAAILILPINGLIFAIENLIFLIAPYQRNKEGIDVFLRTILTFTAKGVLFAIGLAVVIVWALVVNQTTKLSGLPPAVGGLVFGGGIWCLVLAVTAMLVHSIARRFAAFDPSQDTPGIG